MHLALLSGHSLYGGLLVMLFIALVSGVARSRSSTPLQVSSLVRLTVWPPRWVLGRRSQYCSNMKIVGLSNTLLCGASGEQPLDANLFALAWHGVLRWSNCRDWLVFLGFGQKFVET